VTTSGAKSGGGKMVILKREGAMTPWPPVQLPLRVNGIIFIIRIVAIAAFSGKFARYSHSMLLGAIIRLCVISTVC